MTLLDEFRAPRDPLEWLVTMLTLFLFYQLFMLIPPFKRRLLLNLLFPPKKQDVKKESLVSEDLVKELDDLFKKDE